MSDQTTNRELPATSASFAALSSLDSLTLGRLIQTGSAEQKQQAIYLLLKNLLGDRMQGEAGVYDPEGFLYAYLVPPGLREALRLLEDPERAARLSQTNDTDTYPLRRTIDELKTTIAGQEKA